MKFVKKCRPDCQPIADRLKVPVENILGLAAQESQYGEGRIASQYNNYFSMHAPAVVATKPIHRQMQSSRGSPVVEVKVSEHGLGDDGLCDVNGDQLP